MAFVKYIVTIVGEAQYARLKENNKKRMLRDFEYGIKRSFTGDPGKDYSVELKGVEDNEEEGIDDDSIPLRVCVNSRIGGKLVHEPLDNTSAVVNVFAPATISEESLTTSVVR